MYKFLYELISSRRSFSQTVSVQKRFFSSLLEFFSLYQMHEKISFKLDGEQDQLCLLFIPLRESWELSLGRLYAQHALNLLSSLHLWNCSFFFSSFLGRTWQYSAGGAWRTLWDAKDRTWVWPCTRQTPAVAIALAPMKLFLKRNIILELGSIC